MSAATVVGHSSHPQVSSNPMDSVATKAEVDQLRNTSSVRRKGSPSRTDIQPSIEEPELGDRTGKGVNAAPQPLAPPPRPVQSQNNEQVDYFSGAHTNSHFSREPNPFDKSFGEPPGDAKSLLPPVASLTSPAALAPESASAGGYSFSNSLRSGPLSPAMLGGPVGAGGDYFGPQSSTAFPGVTPNESSLRTGLTPGGSGSMFPVPSPGSQAFIQQLANGGATPSTLDFHRTAVNAAAANKLRAEATAQDTKPLPASSMDPLLQQQSNQQQTFGQHDNDAANGLYLLAQATNDQAANDYANHNANNDMNQQIRSMETSPQMTNASQVQAGNRNVNGSAQGDGSDSGDQGKMATRSKGKRSSSGKAGVATNGRRKAEDTPAKQPSAKKQKQSNIMQEMEQFDSDEEQPNIKEEQFHNDGRKMTDEEKRKNFLERNRVAALKCRQRKKQWLQNLQQKVEIFTTENDSLTAQVHALREEIVALKTLLLQHKDCPIAQSQGNPLGHYFQQQQEFNPHQNPYGMGIPNGHQAIPGQRR